MPALLRSIRAAARWPAMRPWLQAKLPGGGACEVCRAWSSARLCAGCAQQFAKPMHRCMRCALGLPEGQTICGACLHEAPAFDRTACVADYAFPWDRLIQRLKFGAQPELALMLAQRMHAASAALTLRTPDLFVPVPLSVERLAERGYDQAWELARHLAAQAGVPARPQALQRRFDVQRQSALSRAQRLSNLRGAFVVPAGQHPVVAGQHVALVDDVLTTGATAQAAAHALREAGARAVDLWVVARTPSPSA